MINVNFLFNVSKKCKGNPMQTKVGLNLFIFNQKKVIEM